MERLQQLIDQDQEYQKLVAEANAFSGGSKFPTDSMTLEIIKRNFLKFKNMKAEQFFATFKCMVG